MSTASGGLKDLHALHIQLRDVQEKLDRGPKQVQARRQHARRKQAEADAKKEQLLQLRKTADQKTLQLKSNEAKITSLKVKLNAASSNKEFDIIKSQIDADTMANSVLEDEILEVLEKVDVLGAELKKLNEEVAAAEAEAMRMADEVAAAEPGLRVQAARVEEAIGAAEGTLPAAIKQVYRRLVQAHGAGALAAVENNACTACYAVLAPQERVQIRTGTIIFCRSCGRLLYSPDSE